jgi:AcrR family transcriptional regulator
LTPEQCSGIVLPMTDYTEKQTRTRESILKAAHQLMLEKGIEKLSLREIARTVGFSPSSLYEYFDGKDKIISALKLKSSVMLYQSMKKASKGLDPLFALASMSAAYVRFSKTNSEDFVLLFNRSTSTRRTLNEPEIPSSGYALVLETVISGIDEGQINKTKDRSAEDMAYGLWALVHGMAILQTTHLKGFEANFENADREVISAFLNGLKQ